MVSLFEVTLKAAANQVCLYWNESKTEFITTSFKFTELKSLSNISIKNVDDFKYLESHIADSQKNLRICKALAWNACNRLDKIWHSNLPHKLKVQTFRTLIEPVFLYESETWTLLALIKATRVNQSAQKDLEHQLEITPNTY
ncbi:uncharacterized protein LOC115222315 [Octopus sinensis]|uniref:Uncharacterized protein LOC115222315 n=1 Tax=Octopus sinensis TaxID=2607531 RepID=A0A6P7TEH0_9MOLL|nr:uncharacterized protein LOC115222315 [Octopus sinensis]